MVSLKHHSRRKKILVMFVVKSVNWKTRKYSRSSCSTVVKFSESGIIHVFYTACAENVKGFV